MVVNWNSNNPDYLQSVKDVRVAGQELANKIKELGATDIHCMGYSLGNLAFIF